MLLSIFAALSFVQFWRFHFGTRIQLVRKAFPEIFKTQRSWIQFSYFVICEKEQYNSLNKKEHNQTFGIKIIIFRTSQFITKQKLF